MAGVAERDVGAGGAAMQSVGAGGAAMQSVGAMGAVATTAGATRPPAGPAARRMAGIAAASVAVATWCAAAAAWLPVGGLGLPLGIVGVLLAASVAGAVGRRSTRVLPAGKDVLVLTALTAAGVFVAYLAGWVDQEHLVAIARLLPLVVLGLSVLWPEPNVLRYCLLLAGGTLLGAPEPAPLAVGGSVVAMALALVATNRLVAAAAPRLGGVPPVRGRRLAAEAGAVLVVVGLLAALAASVVPPPKGAAGGESPGGTRPGRLPAPAAPAIHFDDEFGLGAGRGERGDEYVLLVGATAPDVWQALTYDHWDGQAWSRSPEERSLVDADVEPGIGDVETRLEAGDRLFQSVTILARSADVLVAAPRPSYTDVDAEKGVDSSLFPTTPLARGDVYFVLSDRAAASAADLRALGDTPAREVPFDVADAYLQLPQVSPRVTALAAGIAARESTTFDKARAVEDWIHDNTTVTDDAVAVPAGADPLETFLFDARSGPPERAASAMAVMLRAVGVPSRLAVGFLPGQRDGPDDPFAVRLSDTHAWVEVWFPTVGWQRFDPTGRAPDPRAEEASVWDRLLRFLQTMWPLLVVLLLAAGVWLAWRLAVRRRRGGALPLAPHRRAALPWVTRYYAQLERAGAARGRPRHANETPKEYTSALVGGALPDPRLEEVGALVTVAAWSQHEPAAEDRARAEEVLRTAMKAAPVPRRTPQGGPRFPRLRRLPAWRLRRGRRPRPTIAKP